MRKIKIGVLMGGMSTEHEVSILSGQQVVLNLDRDKYEVLPVVISKTGSWQLTSDKEISNLLNPINLKGTKKEISLKEVRKINNIESISDRKIDVVFVALHGNFGEDGVVQGMLELAQVKYTGSGVLASAVGMDKDAFRKIMIAEGLPVPKYISIDKQYKLSDVFKKLGKMPYFIKPVSGGSSVGASIARDENELNKGLKEAFKYGKKVLIDEYVQGRELTCAVLGNDTLKVLPVIEIKPIKGHFFDYESKYTESGAEEIVPANLDKKITKKIQELSLRVFKALNCRGFGRIDFILKNNGDPVILEINTIPGLTPMSLLPKAAAADGISYSALLDIIIKNALN